MFTASVEQVEQARAGTPSHLQLRIKKWTSSKSNDSCVACFQSQNFQNSQNESSFNQSVNGPIQGPLHHRIEPFMFTRLTKNPQIDLRDISVVQNHMVILIDESRMIR